jgi:hypothetical protein
MGWADLLTAHLILVIFYINILYQNFKKSKRIDGNQVLYLFHVIISYILNYNLYNILKIHNRII